MGVCCSRPRRNAAHQGSGDDIPLQPILTAVSITMPDRRETETPLRTSVIARIDGHPAKGEHDVAPDGYDRELMTAALSLMGAYLRCRRKKIRLVATEGIVAVFLFRIQERSSEIACFGFSAWCNELIEAARYAYKSRINQQGRNLHANWFTYHRVFNYPHSHLTELVNQAFRQNAVVFRYGGLEIIAPPYKMLFCDAIERCTHSANPLNYKLAARYLMNHIRYSGPQQTPVGSMEIKQWAESYGKTFEPGVLNEIANKYQEVVGMPGIIFQTAASSNTEQSIPNYDSGLGIASSSDVASETASTGTIRPNNKAPARPKDKAPARPKDKAPARPNDKAPARDAIGVSGSDWYFTGFAPQVADEANGARFMTRE